MELRNSSRKISNTRLTPASPCQRKKRLGSSLSEFIKILMINKSWNSLAGETNFLVMRDSYSLAEKCIARWVRRSIASQLSVEKKELESLRVCAVCDKAIVQRPSFVNGAFTY